MCIRIAVGIDNIGRNDFKNYQIQIQFKLELNNLYGIL